MGAVHHSIAPSMYPRLDYNIETDFVPVGLISSVPQVIVVNPQRVAARTLPELLDNLRKNPAKLNYGSAGNGTSHHLAGELFKLQTKTFITHIPYRGAGGGVVEGDFEATWIVGGQEEGGFHAVELGGQAHRPEQAAGDQRRIAEGGTQARDAAQEFGQAPVGSRVGQAQLPRVGPGRQHVVGDLRILRLVEAQAGADGLAFQAEIHEGEDGIVAVVGLDPQLAIGHQRAVLHVVAQVF